MGQTGLTKSEAFPDGRRRIGFVAPECDFGRGDSFKAFDSTPIGFTVERQTKGLQQLGCRTKPDSTAFLADGQGCPPDRNEPVLAERQAVLTVPGDLQHEAAVRPGIIADFCRWPADWQPTENERTGIEGQLLPALIPLRTGQLEVVQALVLALRKNLYALSRGDDLQRVADMFHSLYFAYDRQIVGTRGPFKAGGHLKGILSDSIQDCTEDTTPFLLRGTKGGQPDVWRFSCLSDSVGNLAGGYAHGIDPNPLSPTIH